MPETVSVHIERRKHLRRMLVALAEQRLRAPGTVIPMREMFEVGWPGERAMAKAAATRVYTAIHALRTLGIGEALIRRHGGYVLEAEVQWAHETDRPPPFVEAAPLEHLYVTAS